MVGGARVRGGWGMGGLHDFERWASDFTGVILSRPQEQVLVPFYRWGGRYSKVKPVSRALTLPWRPSAWYCFPSPCFQMSHIPVSVPRLMITLNLCPLLLFYPQLTNLSQPDSQEPVRIPSGTMLPQTGQHCFVFPEKIPGGFYVPASWPRSSFPLQGCLVWF